MVKAFGKTPGVSQKFVCKVSSSTFWFVNNRFVKTTISFLDYWRLKNNLKVNIFANTFNMNGKLIEKKEIKFSKGFVKNFTPLNGKSGCGSVEIKITAEQNLRIPYAAIVAIYNTKMGITGVHSYSRVYYEKGENMSRGIEGSWTIRDTEKVSSFCVFHNGNKSQEKQLMKASIQNIKNDIISIKIKIPKIRPYGTIKINLKDYVPNLVNFLEGEIGTVSTEFNVKGGFARMLIGNESSLKGYDMQVTHSNFLYQKLGSDYLERTAKSLKLYPGKVNSNSKFIIYPHLVNGNYKAIVGKKVIPINEKQKVIDVKLSESQREISFRASKGSLPSRIQLGIVSQNNKKRIPNEVAFSAITTIEPLKRFHWGICALGVNVSSKIIILDFKSLDKKYSNFSEISICLYSSNNKKVHKKVFSNKNILKKFSEGISIYSIFKDLKKPSKMTYGYYSVFSQYGRFLCYSEITNQHGSTFKEHSF